jgi:hypothetical protein
MSKLPKIEQLGPEYWQRRKRELAAQFPGALLGWPPDDRQAALEAFYLALEAGSEEAIQQAFVKDIFLMQYAVEHSGHHGIWGFSKQMIKPRGANGSRGLIPDFLIATKSSLGYFWHVVELKRFDMQFANQNGDALSPEGNKAVAQCNAYLSHFQGYIETIRSNVCAPEIVQPVGAILLMGDAQSETDAQQKVRSDFVRNNPRIEVVSYRRILGGLTSELERRS